MSRDRLFDLGRELTHHNTARALGGDYLDHLERVEEMLDDFAAETTNSNGEITISRQRLAELAFHLTHVRGHINDILTAASVLDIGDDPQTIAEIAQMLDGKGLLHVREEHYERIASVLCACLNLLHGRVDAQLLKGVTECVTQALDGEAPMVPPPVSPPPDLPFTYLG